MPNNPTRFKIGYMHEDHTMGVIGFAPTLAEAMKISHRRTMIYDTAEHRYYDPRGIPEHLSRRDAKATAQTDGMRCFACQGDLPQPCRCAGRVGESHQRVCLECGRTEGTNHVMACVSRGVARYA
jgi:hypothetical protein